MPPAGTGVAVALIAEAALAGLVFVAIGPALGHPEALLFLAVLPAAMLAGCSALLYLALKALALGAQARREAPALGSSWTLGAVVGLFGIGLGAVAGPHLGASIGFYFLVAQTLAFAVGYRSLLRRSASSSKHGDA